MILSTGKWIFIFNKVEKFIELLAWDHERLNLKTLASTYYTSGKKCSKLGLPIEQGIIPLRQVAIALVKNCFSIVCIYQIYHQWLYYCIHSLSFISL